MEKEMLAILSFKNAQIDIVKVGDQRVMRVKL